MQIVHPVKAKCMDGLELMVYVFFLFHFMNY